ncbi:AGE family epimerase/isomerase [uncultured Thiothrix sp.]|jgi:mannose/cellobiose epimerase-like protein (N-acyl-D-glucosamine 2-epimerase family)|uniref:AGE family epimerase/isomerase n=1 Tax=uncultured Thiothrix sp. TaxID=223185 RepID=UPI002636026C|nr:AGE family epimerase/isomerase [uncultured Thiothrix sp.]HMT93528.1 AGE family epimerase/isomerase [Thiolinea sp.]
MNKHPDFYCREFLEQHIRKTLQFYQPTVFDPAGGFYHFFRDDGSVYHESTRHLVSSTRFVFNYAMATRYFADLDYSDWVRHGLAYLETVHRQPATGGYAWLLENGKATDTTNHCYGLAFVIVAGATALLAGVEEGRTSLDKAWQLLERYYWDETHGLYRDETNADFSVISPYRGQNANMHAFEALLWAYEATQEQHFLQRAVRLADSVSNKLAGQAQGLIWEHYDANWQIDWQYNLDNPKHLFRPWGFQPGHQTEWAKLLLILHRHQPAAWQLNRAEALFNQALERAWDQEYGGICYGFAPDGSICDGDKYFWVQAESFAAAALLAQATNKPIYRAWYERIWDYSWQYLIDHQYGAWFRILTRDNQKYDEYKSPAGKTDYHTMGACYEVLRSGLV